MPTESAHSLRHSSGPALLLAALWTLTAAWPCRAETVYLRDGNIITGEVLAHKADFTALDIGFTILEVPNKQILKIEAEKALPTEEDGTREAEDENLLYRQAQLRVRPVKDLAARFGEGVVLVRTPRGMGSGFLINDDGYVITNAHVIQSETTLSVTLFIRQAESFSRRQIKDVAIVAINPFMDLALLKIEPPEDLKLTPLSLGEMDEVRTGDPVFAIGNPLGFERTVSEGIVSTKTRAAGPIVLVQTTAPINPGNSGGPLFNMHGEVIGVTNMKIGAMAEGMGFAVPVNFVKDFLKFREAFAYDKDNPNTGYHYLAPPHGPEAEEEEGEADDGTQEPED